MSVWRYVIVNDDGSAPNYGRPRLTLAICKPRIRKNAEVDDIILAFESKILAEKNRTIHRPNRIVWAGLVGERISFAEYWVDKRFWRKKPDQSRCPDNIYRPCGREYRQVSNSVHGLCDASRDLSGQYVLIMKEAWRFREQNCELPVGLAEFNIVSRTRQGHRRSAPDAKVAARLLTWLRRNGTDAVGWKAPQNIDSQCGRRCSQRVSPCRRGSRSPRLSKTSC
ncbi:MAG: hypothetical protein ACOY6K_11505 [Pseudomonadota bacterium]